MVSLAFAGVGQIVRLCLISGESASARTHCLLGPHASCPASQAIRVRTEQVPDMSDQTRPGGPAPRSREALPPESERRCGGDPTVQEGGGDPSIKKKTPMVLGIQHDSDGGGGGKGAVGWGWRGGLWWRRLGWDRRGGAAPWMCGEVCIEAVGESGEMREVFVWESER